MKKLAMLLMVIVTAGLTTKAEAASLGEQLVELESHVKWSAVTTPGET